MEGKVILKGNTKGTAMKYFVLAIIMVIVVQNCTSLADTFLPGASLTGNQTIISRNGTFAMGFFSPSGGKNWYIGIWYARTSQKANVWVANRGNPVKSMPGVLNFSRDGRLRLFDREGRSVWSTNNRQKASRALIMDSGNFVMEVVGAHNKSEIVWESFDHPGNTWLPGMKMWKGLKLTSWKSSVDPATGPFSYGLDTSPGKTQILMLYNNSVPYWSSGEWTGNSFTKIPEMSGQNIVQMSCVRVSPSSMYLNFFMDPKVKPLTARLVLDENGEFGTYFWMDDSRWSLVWSTHRGQCSEYEICGAYGACTASDFCTCLQGFTPKDNYSMDSQKWWSSGCVRRTPLQCSATEGTADGFLQLENKFLPDDKAVSYNQESTEKGCQTFCLGNCSCTAFSVTNSNPPFCRLWFGDLFKIRDSSQGQSLFIRLAASELPLTQSTSQPRSKAPALRILLPGISALVALLAAVFIIWRRRRLAVKNIMEDDVPTSLRMFTYRELKIATQNFKHKLGSGAFGSVFKGTLPDHTLVAVKRLEGSTHAEKQFRAEINTIGKLQHVNLVRLCGFCVERSQRLLVYEYMCNGSLNSFLFCKSEELSGKVLDWKTRFEIALGTARGLVYLHEECRDRIIHCDIKPENILLDAYFSPKVADFGLAKLVGRDFSRVLTTTRGTRGYLAPEWISGIPITPKADVYSFGMTLLEILSGRRNLDFNVEPSRFYFPTWASTQIQKENIIDVVDTRIADNADIDEVRRAAVVGGLCIQEDENRRPTMGEVIKILEGTMEPPAPQIPRYLEVLLEQEKSDSFV